MNWSAISAAILHPTTGYLALNWLDTDDPPAALTPIAYDNVQYDPIQGVPFLRASLKPIGSTRKVMTGDHETGILRSGLLFFQVFIEANIGDGDAHDFCDLLEELFREHVLAVGSEQITFGDLNKMGQDTDNAWFFQTFNVPFEHYAM